MSDPTNPDVVNELLDHAAAEDGQPWTTYTSSDGLWQEEDGSSQ
jgi:hypothetical protein